MNYFGTFGSDESEAMQLLMPIIDKALLAHESGNYDDYCSLITDKLAEKVSREGFAKAHREIAPQLGTLESKSFLGSLNQGENPMLTFSARYSGIEEDIVITIIFENGSEPPLIDWLWIE